ncbi:hypothetical protein B9Z55_004660 [Caenorhabditis nigoni]|uniref:Uncharacterized protein n=1 Tax=Caenorhabditis nigoni TaxID=1611254 RepID=A0A2G5UY88_9PELO|nr:hypothetical protein B9Z55_004660 [Caenorhabditis nigoni]
MESDAVPLKTPQISIDVEDDRGAGTTASGSVSGSRPGSRPGSKPASRKPSGALAENFLPSQHHRNQWAHDQNRRNMSFEKSGNVTRNVSEDSRNLRFVPNDAPPRGARKKSHQKKGFHNIARRMTLTPEQLKKLPLKFVSNPYRSLDHRLLVLCVSRSRPLSSGSHRRTTNQPEQRLNDKERIKGDMGMERRILLPKEKLLYRRLRVWLSMDSPELQVFFISSF